MIHANCMTTVARRVKRLVLHVYKFGAHPLKVAPRALLPGCHTRSCLSKIPAVLQITVLEQVRTRTQWVSPSPRLRLYPCGLGLGLALHLGGLGFKRCGLRLWSDGLGLGLTVSPLRNVQGKLRLLHATMAKIRERINEITKLVPLCSISGVTGGGGGAGGAECPPPETSDREILADVSGKKRQGKNGKGWKLSRKGGKLEINWKWKQENVRKRGEDLFFFFAFHFWKRRKFVLGLPKWEFSTGKKHFTPGKNQEKWLCPLRKICLLRPCVAFSIVIDPYLKLLVSMIQDISSSQP